MQDDRPTAGDPQSEARRSNEGRGLAGLASELVELARDAPERLAARVAELTIREQAELALRLPAKQRIELLLHAPRPMRLVRALPDAELYLTTREVGPADALPLLNLASASQLHHVVDLESWRKDRFDAERSGAWAALFLEAGEPTLRRFLRTADDELLALLFASWIRVDPIETDEPAEIKGSGHSEAGDENGMVTPDGEFRFRPAIAEHAAAIRRILQIFFQEQPRRYEQTLISAVQQLPSELEEQALHWRQSRLEEHGFPAWDEALSIYAPPQGHGIAPEPVDPADPDALAAARSPLRTPSTDALLPRTIDQLPDALREQVLHGLVSLANHVLVAEGADTGDPDAHRQALERATGYVSIGLRARGADEPAATRPLLEELQVFELFREGFARAAALQARARSLAGSDWAAVLGDWLSVLDSPLRERIAGLLERRPLYFDLRLEEGSGGLRDFRSIAELEETAAAVEMVSVAGAILVGRLGLDVAPVLRWSEGAGHPFRLSALLLTVLAWHATRGEPRADPLPASVTADFLRNFVSRRTAGPDAAERALPALVEECAGKAGLSPREVSVFQAFGRFCLEELSEQCSTLDPGVPPDPRGVSCLLLELVD